MTANDNTKQHHGRNIKRLREIRGIKQEALAVALEERLGEGWNQSKVSYMEGRETIENELLEEVAKILKVPTEAIQNLPETLLPAIFSPVFNDSSAAGWFANFPTFNLNGKVIELFERLITSEREKVELVKREQELLKKEIELLKKEMELLQKKGK